MRFEMPPHVFDRIEFGCISRQPFNHDASFGGRNVIFDQHASMDRCAIPDDQDFPAQMPLKVIQKFDDLEAFDAAGVNLEIKPPERQAANDRKAFPVERFVQHRSLPTRGPSAGPCWASAQSAFVDKDDGLPLLLRLFFKAGHSVRDQRRIALSSRSTARRSGRWQLKPLAPSKRQT